MCLQKSAVMPWDSWNWSGDEIIPTPIILASRTIPGTSKRYNIDIREFLTTTNNAVVHQALNDLIRALPQDQHGKVRSHSPGSFDLRADSVVQYVGGNLKYKRSANKVALGPDAWLFPDETLSQGGGDCEDLALLLAALLIASGISSYCVRVALGRLRIKIKGATEQSHDHCWVMYHNEAGIWEILEPLHVVAPKASRSRPALNAPQTEYVPHYVFNSDHLWQIDLHGVAGRAGFMDYCQKRGRGFWSKFDPSFAASVHSDIFDQALGGLGLPSGAIPAMKRKSLFLDVNIATYDPRDHFDNGYIDEGWTTVAANLEKFRSDKTDWSSFGAAGHGIADFYAHSSYAHFAPLQNGSIPTFNPGQALTIAPGYTSTPPDPSLSPFDLTSGVFSTNTNKWHGSPAEAAATWQGKLISGRYAQLYDPKAGFWEGFTSIPESLAKVPGFALRGSLPHHNEIAVDELSRPSKHVLYRDARSGPSDRQSYQNQFNWRKQAAIQHIATAHNSIVRE
jgi:hypothetical protein